MEVPINASGINFRDQSLHWQYQGRLRSIILFDNSLIRGHGVHTLVQTGDYPETEIFRGIEDFKNTPYWKLICLKWIWRQIKTLFVELILHKE